MESAVLEAMSRLLDLEGFELAEVISDRAKKTHSMTLATTMTLAPCPHCLVVTGERHTCHPRKVRDLPLCGWQVELNFMLFQFKCGRCGKYFTPQYPGLRTDGAHATERLLERLAELISHSDVASAANFLGIPEKTAEDWYYDFLKRKQKEPAKGLQPVKALGIDEISLKKDSASSAAC